LSPGWLISEKTPLLAARRAPGWTVSHIISGRLGHNVTADLVLIPLVTATIGWPAAAATARLRPRLTASVVSLPVMATGRVGEGSRSPVTAPHAAERAVRVRGWHQTARLLLLSTVVAAAAARPAASWLRG